MAFEVTWGNITFTRLTASISHYMVIHSIQTYTFSMYVNRSHVTDLFLPEKIRAGAHSSALISFLQQLGAVAGGFVDQHIAVLWRKNPALVQSAHNALQRCYLCFAVWYGLLIQYESLHSPKSWVSSRPACNNLLGFSIFGLSWDCPHCFATAQAQSLAVCAGML